MEQLSGLDFKFDLVFADPPYFLSNDGLSVQNGKVASVNKGAWDKSPGLEYVHDFNRRWLSAVSEKMNDDASIWISGTMHNIFSIGQALNEMGFKILNVITWQKKNPPPNFSCRYFTYSTEQIIWAKKNAKVPHYFDYDLMRRLNQDAQMKDVWLLSAIGAWEKTCGKHPTQKPLPLLARIMLASSKKNAWILDPFAGSGTTGIAANLLSRKFLGIDQESEFLKIAQERRIEIDDLNTAREYGKRLAEQWALSPKDAYKLIFEGE